jgi:hypothetical protein
MLPITVHPALNDYAGFFISTAGEKEFLNEADLKV